MSTIGGDFCNRPISAELLPGDIQELTAHERDALWQLFQAIGDTWGNSNFHSINIKSTWLEFIHAKTTVAPSYTGEYSNAVSCISELIEMYGAREAYRKLFFEYRGATPPLTRLAHAKIYVVDEFIRMQVSQEGFKSWNGANYKGYVGGSRFNRKPRARVFSDQDPNSGSSQAQDS